MDYKTLLHLVKLLKIGETKTVYSANDTSLKIFRPEKLGGSLKNKDYDITKNFQIIMEKHNEKPFLPNHLRVLLNLHLMMQTNHEAFEKFHSFIEEVYKGADPDKFKDEVLKMSFKIVYDPPMITLYCAQLFMAEQDTNYTDGKIQPPRAYIMGYIRLLSTGQENIDKLLWSSIRHPPKVKFWRDYIG